MSETYESSDSALEEDRDRDREQSLLTPEDGDVVIELHRDGGFPIMMPLLGNWERMLEESVDDWVYALRTHNRIHFDAFVVAVFQFGSWQRRAMWSDGGVRWLK